MQEKSVTIERFRDCNSCSELVKRIIQQVYRWCARNCGKEKARWVQRVTRYLSARSCDASKELAAFQLLTDNNDARIRDEKGKKRTRKVNETFDTRNCIGVFLTVYLFFYLLQIFVSRYVHRSKFWNFLILIMFFLFISLNTSINSDFSLQVNRVDTVE